MGDIEIVKESLIQIHELKKTKLESEQQLLDDPNIDVEDLLQRQHELEERMIKEKDWKFASYNVPLEIHIQFIIFWYEVKNWELFNILLRSALIRLKFRRYEIPYLSTVDVLMSTLKDADVPESFEKLEIDMNAANLRIELKKIRKRQQDQVNEFKNKLALSKTKSKNLEIQDPAKEESFEINENLATDEELGEIRHVFVNILLQRSKNPKNAIIDLDVIMVNENDDSQIPDGYYAVAVPIRQHEGVYEKSRTIPYIVFKRTKNNLRDEKELLSLVTDVTVISGKNPYIQPPMGFERINVDLRQTPKELANKSNLDYVYIWYRTDRDINIYERDLLLLKKLYDIDQSIKQIGTPEYNTLPESHKYLNLTYNVDLLLDLAQVNKDILSGPVGYYYWTQRKDFFEEYAHILIHEYLIPVRLRINQYVELRTQKEFSSDEEEKFTDLVYKIKSNFKDVLMKTLDWITESYNESDKEYKANKDKQSFNPFATHTRQGPITKNITIGLYFATLLEEGGEYREAIQLLRTTLNTIITLRESRISKKPEYSRNPITLLYLHLVNHRIIENKAIIDQNYKIWENIILKKERARFRESSDIEVLDEDEANEEAYEIENFENLLKNKLYKLDDQNPDQDPDILLKVSPFVQDQLYTNYDEYLNDLHIDVLVNLYRCEIKLGQELEVINSQTNKLLAKQGLQTEEDAETTELETTLSSKFKTKYSVNMSKARKEFKQLNQSYKETGKICKSA